MVPKPKIADTAALGIKVFAGSQAVKMIERKVSDEIWQRKAWFKAVRRRSKVPRRKAAHRSR